VSFPQLARKAVLKFKRTEGAAVVTLANPTIGKISIPLTPSTLLISKLQKKRIAGFPNPNAKPKIKKGNNRVIPMNGLPHLLRIPDFNS
jgi:hypothetical protein